MTKQMIMLALALFMLCATVQAVDLNGTANVEELQQRLAELEATAQQTKTQVVTVRMDAETQKLFNNLEDKMADIVQKIDVFEERFVSLKTDMGNKVDSSASNIKSELEGKFNKKIDESQKETQDYTRLMTNPLRINLPNFALWLMVTAVFMLDRKSTRLNSSHIPLSRMPSSA